MISVLNKEIAVGVTKNRDFFVYMAGYFIVCAYEKWAVNKNVF